jgi:hypothetical protein
MKITEEEINRLVATHGERYRGIITNALTWLEEKEPKWNLSKPIDRDQFIIELLEGVEVSSE